MTTQEPLIQHRPLTEIVEMHRLGAVGTYEALYGIENSQEQLAVDAGRVFYKDAESILLNLARKDVAGPSQAIEMLPKLAMRFLPAAEREAVYETVRDMILQKHIGPSSHLKAHEAYPAAAARAIIDVAEKLVSAERKAEILKRDLSPVLELALARAEAPEFHNNVKVLDQSAGAASIIANALGMNGHRDERLWVSDEPTGHVGKDGVLGIALVRAFIEAGNVRVNTGANNGYLHEALQDDRNGKYNVARREFLAAVAGRNQKTEIRKVAAPTHSNALILQA